MATRPTRLIILAVTVLLLTALLSAFIGQGVSRYAVAQQPPIPPTPTRPPTPTPPVIPTPDIPKYSFKGPSLDIPREARQSISDKDFIDVFCLTSQWQMELFYQVMDIWGPGFVKVKEIATPMGVQMDIPDLAALKAQGKAKVDAVCAAASVEAAQSAVGELLSFGSATQDTFQQVGKTLEARFRDEGNKLAVKIEKQANDYAEQEKTRLTKEMSTKIAALIPKSSGGAPPNMQAIQAQINTLVQQTVAEITQNMEKYVNGIVEKEVGPFKQLDALLTDLGAKSVKARATDTPRGAELKRQAIAKRKQIVQRMLDVNITRAKTELEGARADLELAKRNDPSVKNVDEILAELARDRQALERKIDTALASDVPGADAEIQFRAAIDEFVNKWTALAQQAEKQRPNAITIRDRARPQLILAKAQLLAGAQSITLLLSQSAGKTDSQSEAVNAQASQLTALKDKLNALASRIDQAIATLDKVTADSPVKPLMELLDAIQKEGDALQNDIGAGKATASKRESVFIQAEDELAAFVTKPGTEWDSVKENKPSWRAGWTGTGDWYLSRQGDKLTYKFNIQNRGVFYVWVRDWDDGKHSPGSGAIDMEFYWGSSSAPLKNVPENTVRNSQHQWHQVGQVTLGAPGQIGFSVLKSTTTSKAAILDAFFLSTDANERPPEAPPTPKKTQTVETILIQAEDETAVAVSKPGTNWDSTEEVKPSWRSGWTGTGDWYLSRQGDRLTYKFNIQNPGTFYVWARDWDDGKHQPGSGAIDMDFSFAGGTAQLKNVPENTVRNSQHQWHQVGQVTLGAAGATGVTAQGGPTGGVVAAPGSGPGLTGVTMTITKSATTTKAAVLDAFLLTTDPAVKP